MLDNYAFVRTSGYLPGPNDVYVSLSQVRRHGLRKGDAVTGAVRQPAEGERREKFNALVRLDSVNGADPEQGRQRVEFNKLTPLYPQERLRLENPEATRLTPRVIDIVAPIGKGQRGLIVAPPKAGKTILMQKLANAMERLRKSMKLMIDKLSALKKRMMSKKVEKAKAAEARGLAGRARAQRAGDGRRAVRSMPVAM